MALADRRAEMERKQVKCKVCDLIPGLTKEDRATLESWFKDGWSPTSISRALTLEGHPVSEKPVARHMAGGHK